MVFGALTFGLALGAGCPDRCLRNSDCESGLQCIAGQCAPPMSDLGPPQDLAPLDMSTQEMSPADLLSADLSDGG